MFSQDSTHPARSYSTKISRDARRRNQAQVDDLVRSKGMMKTSAGTGRVQEILRRCNYLASKRGQDLHVLKKTLKEDEERAESEQIAQRLSMYFASLSNQSSGGGGGSGENCGGAGHAARGGCSCFHIADWPSLEHDYLLMDDHQPDSDDIDEDDEEEEEDELADELYSTVYLGGTSDWAKKTDGTQHNNSSRTTDSGSSWSNNHVVGY